MGTKEHRKGRAGTETFRQRTSQRECVVVCPCACAHARMPNALEDGGPGVIKADGGQVFVALLSVKQVAIWLADCNQ